tara:strand:+ start:4412 stop:4912 length:501 start_codon:yes stop_codon:yes gene_type:complete
MEEKVKEKQEISIDELKEKYNEFKQRYGLPEFSEMNKIFDIEDTDVETEFFLRKIRRVVSDRISGYLRFVEVILNPSNAPMFIFKLIKKLGEDDKKQLTEIYDVLGKLEIEIIALDLDYDENREVEFIKKTYEVLNNNISKKLLLIVKKMGNGGEEKKDDKGSYFG